MNGFYYNGLLREEKTAYEQMKAGFEALAATVRVVRLEQKRLAEVYLRLKLDEPLLFYVTGYSYRFYPASDHVELIPEYLFEKSKIRTHQQAVSARIQRLTRPLQGKSQAEKELYIHDFILDNVRYDKLKKSYSHEVIGPPDPGSGRVRGYCQNGEGAVRRRGLGMHHRPQRGKPRAGRALPPYLEYTDNRRKAIPHGCHL